MRASRASIASDGRPLSLRTAARRQDRTSNFGLGKHFPLFTAGAMSFGVPLTTGCCPRYGCEYTFGTNWQGRHAAFVDNLQSAVGHPISSQTCFIDGACRAREELGPGLVRYVATAYPGWMKGCTYWFDVNVNTGSVQAVGYEGVKQPDGREPCWVPLQGVPKEIRDMSK
jgi:hypothetical protein